MVIVSSQQFHIYLSDTIHSFWMLVRILVHINLIGRILKSIAGDRAGTEDFYFLLCAYSGHIIEGFVVDKNCLMSIYFSLGLLVNEKEWPKDGILLLV